MAGAIAGAYYGVSEWIAENAMSNLSKDLYDVVVRFETRLAEKLTKTDKYIEVNADEN